MDQPSPAWINPALPRSLRDPAVCERRRALLSAPHVVPLAAYAARLRLRPGTEVPDFDPLDGGIAASVLFLLEKPGPTAAAARAKRTGSGFVSRDNDTPTAEAIHRFMLVAGLPRQETVIWNMVPWWNGTVAITGRERTDGAVELAHPMALLPRVHTAVLAGRTAARARPLLGGLRLLESAHPSPNVRAGYRSKWDEIPAVWRRAAEPVDPRPQATANAGGGERRPAAQAGGPSR